MPGVQKRFGFLIFWAGLWFRAKFRPGCEIKMLGSLIFRLFGHVHWTIKYFTVKLPDRFIHNHRARISVNS